MATFNPGASSSAADVLSATTATATFLVPTTAAVSHPGAHTAHLQLDQFGGFSAATATPLQHHHHQQTNSSYTFVQIKREPCQVSEISSNNCHQQQQQHHQHHQHQVQHQGLSSASMTASSKTMSSSTLTTLVKIEAPSPKVSELEKSTGR